MNEQRLIDIETKLAFQEHTVQQLHEVIYAQQKRLERLEAAYEILLDRVKEMTLESGGNKPVHEKPPHY